MGPYEHLIREMAWSYSRIKTFYDCPFRWFLKYIRYPREDWDALFFSSYGSLMHELLEKFYKKELSADQALTTYLVNFKSKVPKKAPNPTVFRNYFNDGFTYLSSLAPISGRIVGVEEKVETEISGVPFVGFLDLEIEDDDGFFIVDHKSRALKPRSKRKKPTKSDELLDEYLVQLYLYSEFFRQKRGEFPKYLCFNCFRNNTLIREPFVQEHHERALHWLTSKIEEIAVEKDFDPDIDWFKCTFLCDAHDKCDYFQLMKRGDGVGRKRYSQH